MFLSGEVCPSAPSCNLGWSGAALRVVTDGQKSAEAIVPTGICWVVGKG